MKHKEFLVDDRRKIEVYDNSFSSAEKYQIYLYMVNSKFSISRISAPIPEANSVRKTLQCNLSLRDNLNIGIFNNKIVVDYIRKQFQKNEIRLHHAYILLCTAGDLYQYHLDSNIETNITGLYYGNIEWRPEWEGETHFSDENMSEIIYTSSFIPGRLVFFDATIPHKSSQPSADAPYYRFALAMKLMKPGDHNGFWNKSVNIEDFYFDPKPMLTYAEEPLLQYIQEKTKDILHSGSSLYEHLYKTFCILRSLGASYEAQLAGMFHSAYETEYFKHDANFDKDQVTALIGSYSNSLVEYFCMPEREKIINENTLNLDDKTILDLMYLNYANAIEQAYRIDIPEEWFANMRRKIKKIEGSST
jgi:hypothetical protein